MITPAPDTMSKLLSIGGQSVAALFADWAERTPDKTFLIWAPFEGGARTRKVSAGGAVWLSAGTVTSKKKKNAGNDAWQKTLIIRIRNRKVVTVYVLAERTRTRTNVPEQSAARSLCE